MKAKYVAPQMEQIIIQTQYLISTSTTEQDVYLDDPQTPGSALTRDNIDFWDDEW